MIIQQACYFWNMSKSKMQKIQIVKQNVKMNVTFTYCYYITDRNSMYLFKHELMYSSSEDSIAEAFPPRSN